MLDFSEASIYKFLYNRFSPTDEGNIFNEEAFQFDLDQEETLNKIFLKPFQSTVNTWSFTHAVDVTMNPLHVIAKDIFSQADFIPRANQIHKHLKSVAKHPNIKDGDLFIIHFTKLIFKEESCQGIGIFKIDEKDAFIDTRHSIDELNAIFEIKNGISARKVDKGVLILDTPDEMTVLIVDKAKDDAVYWKDEFVQVELKKDHINNTTQFLTQAKSYITETFPGEFESTKADQVDMLNRTVNYFKQNEKFNREEFERHVLQDQQVIDSFKRFDDLNRNINEYAVEHEFDIAHEAVKKQSRHLKSIIKLDKNFHIYIHGGKENIESGIESNGRKFYKIYYDEEE